LCRQLAKHGQSIGDLPMTRHLAGGNKVKGAAGDVDGAAAGGEARQVAGVCG
jgi:hypothetical protein